jgi:quercetin dioxygenase-like cupin family protein
MEIIRNGAQSSVAGLAECFTGNVRIDSSFKGLGDAHVTGAIVTFESGARSAWHTHRLGQTLIVTSARGWTRCEGGPIVEINAGDIVCCPASHRHWHGATPTTAMTHIAIREAKDGKVVEWVEQVSDEEYLVGPASRPLSPVLP